ncbi:glutathione S-transferase family protein [uncultured Algimonas sp.]|uniref:glutathione S-transferase family protein n=1 Tax=uncultured Algimonas sp. TaxID=1547920 RepID=UPI002621AA78|nr:glutathione S-transferase family protein [uncultured Algimonas sp.]
MRTLYHYPLHPGSRAVRLCFAEKKLKLREVVIDPWTPDEKFLSLSVENVPPVMTDVTQAGTVTVVGSQTLCEYADEASARNPLLPGERHDRAEIRRLCNWFDQRFDQEVNAFILPEKLETVILGGTPDTDALREGRTALRDHLSYIGWLLSIRDGLAGPAFTLADLTAAAHLSCLDYLGEIPWREVPDVQEWYQTIKSRPAFQPLLKDRVPGLRPPRHYGDLDF